MRIINLYQEINSEFSYSPRPCLLFEANLKDLFNKAKRTDIVNHNTGKGYVARGDELVSKVRYFGLSNDGTLNFKVNSQTSPGKFHYVYVQANYDDMYKAYGDLVENNTPLEAKDLNKLLLGDGFRIGCNCQSFLYYGFKYMATMGDYELEPETREPNIRNKDRLVGLCKHLIAVIRNMYENTKMRTQIMKDIENFIKYEQGLDYEEFQTEKAQRMIQQQKHQVKWRNKPSDYMNNYFARLAKNHPFLDDHDIKHSLKMEVNKYIHNNPDGTVDDFLKDFFGMTIDGMADEMDIPVDSVNEYFDELGFTSKKEEQQRKVQDIQNNKQQGTNANILNNNREENNEENIEEEV